MFKKIVFTVSFVLISLYGTAQKDINSYKYIIVPNRFEFSKSEDQYQLNSLAKFLFNKYGYEAYFANDELPQDLKNNLCLALTSEVSNEKSGMFKTKMEIFLKDCFGNTVMTSEIGESRLKQYEKAFNQALRSAFETFQNLDYEYVSSDDTPTADSKTENIVVSESEVPETKDKVKVVPKMEQPKDKTKTDVAKVVKIEPKAEEINASEIYYAQVKDYGYQLVDSEPKIVMMLLTTAAENVFLAKGRSAIVYKEDGFWYYSENDGNLNEKIVMNIKF